MLSAGRCGPRSASMARKGDIASSALARAAAGRRTLAQPARTRRSEYCLWHPGALRRSARRQQKVNNHSKAPKGGAWPADVVVAECAGPKALGGAADTALRQSSHSSGKSIARCSLALCNKIRALLPRLGASASIKSARSCTYGWCMRLQGPSGLDALVKKRIPSALECRIRILRLTAIPIPDTLLPTQVPKSETRMRCAQPAPPGCGPCRLHHGRPRGLAPEPLLCPALPRLLSRALARWRLRHPMARATRRIANLGEGTRILACGDDAPCGKPSSG